MSDIVFKPIISTNIMLIYTAVLLIIILLNRKHVLNRSIIIILFFIITQRPVIEDINNMLYKDLDILFVIDTTVSMNTIDINSKSRIENVKENIIEIIENLKGARYSIITFDNYSMVKMPFTSDISLVFDIVEGIKTIDPNYAIGTSLDLPFENMKVLLESSKDKENHKRIVFFITDGEVNLKNKKINELDKYNQISNLIDNGAVLGYGKESGGNIKITNSIDNSKLTSDEGYLIDKSTKELAVSRLNEQNLLYLKDKLSLNYYHMNNFSALKKKLNEIKKNTIEELGDNNYYDKELYYYFAIIMLILLLYELYYYRRNEQ